MGTSFRKYFEDDVFSRSIRISAIKVFSSCLADLAIFAAATAGRQGALTAEETAALARYCFERSLARHLDGPDHLHVPDGTLPAFNARTRQTDWSKAAEGESAFAGSARDLVRYAPVIDEYKGSDAGIVRNSIRFRWRDVRADLRKRIQPAAIAADYRQGAFVDPAG